MKKPVIIILSLAVILLLCCCVSIAGILYLGDKSIKEADRLNKESLEKQEAQAAKEKEEAAARDKQLLENAPVSPATIEVGSINWKILGSSDKGNRLKALYPGFGQDCVVANGGRFIFIDLEVTNTSKNAIKYFIADNYIELYDNKERSYSTTTTALYSCIDSSKIDYYGSSELNPDVADKFTLIFEVPADAKGFYLKIHEKDSYFSKDDKDGKGYVYIKL